MSKAPPIQSALNLTLETPRLTLRLPSEADAPAHAEMCADPLNAQWLTPDGKPLDKDTAWRNWATIAGHWHFRGYGFFSVIEKETGAWVGRVGLWMPEGWPGFELGWAIHPAFRGKGYAGEAAVAAAGWAFDDLGRDKIISVIRPANHNSRRVAEKMGQNIVGQCEIYQRPYDIWAIKKAEFRTGPLKA